MRTCVGYYTEILLFHTPVFIQFSSVTQLCPTLCNPMNYNTPGVGDEQGGLECCSSWGCKE